MAAMVPVPYSLTAEGMGIGLYGGWLEDLCSYACLSAPPLSWSLPRVEASASCCEPVGYPRHPVQRSRGTRRMGLLPS